MYCISIAIISKEILADFTTGDVLRDTNLPKVLDQNLRVTVLNTPPLVLVIVLLGI